MTEYDYKNFRVHYNVQSDKTKKNLYTADGYILYDNKPVLKQRFHTEYSTINGVQKEIKKLIENYIDFEWEEFYEIHGEKPQSRN